MKIYIDVDGFRKDVKDVLNTRLLPDAKTEIGNSFNDGICVAALTIDTLLLRIKLAYQEDSADD